MTYREVKIKIYKLPESYQIDVNYHIPEIGKMSWQSEFSMNVFRYVNSTW